MAAVTAFLVQTQIAVWDEERLGYLISGSKGLDVYWLVFELECLVSYLND